VATPERRRRGSPEREREGGGGFRGEEERFGFCLFDVSFVCVLFWGKFYSKM
jgi:hypothetical protein